MKWFDTFEFDLTEEEQMVQKIARDFAEKELRPIAAELDRDHRFPEEIIPKLSELGFMGITVPEEYGGSGLSPVAYALIGEEIAYGCASTCVILSAHNSLCIAPLMAFGTDAQKKAHLPDLAAGKTIGCFALSEPGTGSDASNLTCMAVKDGDDFIINGSKNWITNGPVADVCILLAMQEPEKGHKGVTAFIHKTDIDGFSVGKKEHKLGICAVSYTHLTLPTTPYV